MQPVSFRKKRFVAGVSLALVTAALTAMAPSTARAQSEARFSFGAVADAPVGEAVTVPVEVRGLQAARAVEVRVTAPAERFRWTGAEAAEGLDGMTVLYQEARGDTFVVVLSHLDPDAGTTLLRRTPAVRLTGERLAEGAVPLAFAVPPLAAVSQALVPQTGVYADATGTAVDDPAAPAAGIALLDVYPNPARADGFVRFRTPTAVAATAVLFDVAGREVGRTATAAFGPGTHRLALPAPDAAGLYLVRLVLDDGRRTHRLHATLTTIR